MRKFARRLPAAGPALLVAWALGAGASHAQSPSSAIPPDVGGLLNRQLPSPYASNPPAATSVDPPSARRVRSGFATDDRARVRAPIKAIQCGQLLDVREREVKRNVTILIDGERIAEIRDGAIRPTNADAVIDLRDHVCAPGLMDMHLHFAAQAIRPGETDRPRDPFQFTVSETALAIAHARETLYSGVTTIRSPGENLPNGGYMYLRAAIDKWEIPGPRIFAATRMLANDYAREAVVAAGDRYFERRVSGGLSFEAWRPGDDVRAAVRNALALGEEWVKLSVDVGGDLSEGMPYLRIFSFEDMRAAADEAHRLGAKITGHIETDNATRDAVLAGFDSVEHSFIISRETAQLMKERNVYWATTLVDLTRMHDATWYDPTDPLLGAAPARSGPRDMTDWIRRRDEGFKYAYSIGVPIVWASDGIFRPGNHRGRMVLEFSQYLALGVAPWDLLTFATLNPAAMLGEEDDLGSIDSGKLADVIAMPRNPLEDVTAYNDVDFVMKGGNVVRDDLHRSPLPDVFALQLPDVTYVVRDPREPFTIDNLVCIGRDC